MTNDNVNVAFILTLFIAQSLLGVPPASTASERAFSLVAQWRRGDVSYTPTVSMDCCLFTD